MLFKRPKFKFHSKTKKHCYVIVFVADVVESKRILSNTQCLDNFELSPFFILKNLVEEDVVGGLIFLFLLFFWVSSSKQRKIYF